MKSKSEVLRLYRGLSSDEFILATGADLKRGKETWRSILNRRALGEFDFPHDLNREILSLQRGLRLEYQYFTDSRQIAEGYVRKVGGTLVEVVVPVADVLKFFDIEFQNFGSRTKRFEIVYRVKASVLAKNKDRWQLKSRSGRDLRSVETLRHKPVQRKPKDIS